MDVVFGIVLGVVVLTVLVVIHELGHAVAARRSGVVVEEFGIGFPPRAWSKKPKQSFLGKNVTYSINWLPLGGFVKLQGEHDAATGRGDYGAATFWQKTKILLAGVAMNFLAAVVLFTILALIGIPRMLPDQFYLQNDTSIDRQPVRVGYVTKDSAADKSGIKTGDAVLSLAGETIGTSTQLIEHAKAHRGERVAVVYERDGTEQTVLVALPHSNEGKGYLGVGPVQQETLRSTWSAPIVGVALTGQMSAATLGTIGDIIKNFFLQFSLDGRVGTQAKQDLETAGSGLTGPVGIFGQIFPAATKAGPVMVLLIAAVISVSLAVMNILPIPALDGGRWFITALYRLKRKPLTKEVEERINGIGFMVLMGLIVVVTFFDVAKILR